MIGLDRLKLNNISIKSVDIPKVLAFGEIALNEQMGYKTKDVKTGEMIYLEELKLNINGAGLSDNCIAMEIQLNKNGAFKDYTVSVGVNVPKLFYGTNEKNLHTEIEIKNIPNIIQKTCKMHGLEIDLTNTTVTSLEANYNVVGKEFYKTMLLINKVWQHSGNKVFIVESAENGQESIKLKLPTRQIKIYQKDIQLKDVGHVCTTEDITRVEVSTSHTHTMYSIWNSNNLLDIINNFNEVENFYKNTIKNNIQKPFNQYCKEMVNLMYNLLEEGTKPRDLIDKVGLNNLVDLDLYKKAIVKHYKSQNKKNPYTMVKNNINRISNSNKYIGNISKIEEFFKEIGL